MAKLRPEDFRTTDKVTNSFAKGSVRENPAPTPYTPKAASPAQPNKAKDSSVEMGVGEGIDFEQMSDTDKMCFYMACTQYDGRANPEQWASYWAEKEGLPYTNLLKPAMFIHNIVAKEGVQSMKWVADAEQKYPWIAAAKAYDPQQYRGYSGGQISGMLSGVMDKY